MTTATRGDSAKGMTEPMIYADLTLTAAIGSDPDDAARFISAQLAEESCGTRILTIEYCAGENRPCESLKMSGDELNHLIRCLEALRDRVPAARMVPGRIEAPPTKRHLRRA